MTVSKTFDSKCYDTASFFLEDSCLFTEDKCNELAALIQQTIEDFLDDARMSVKLEAAEKRAASAEAAFRALLDAE